MILSGDGHPSEKQNRDSPSAAAAAMTLRHASVDDVIDSLCGKSDSEIRLQLSKLERRLSEVCKLCIRTVPHMNLTTIGHCFNGTFSSGASNSCLKSVRVCGSVLQYSENKHFH